MIPYDYWIPLVLFFIVSVGCALHIGRRFPSSKLFLLVLCIGVLPKLTALTTPYYGTEYEDAFVFQADSKSMEEHSSSEDRFRVQIYDYDLDAGKHTLQSYTGHFTSFSAVVWMGNKIFGYSRFRAIETNLVFSLSLFIVLFMIVYTITNNTYYALISILVFATAPVISLFQSSALAEMYSSLAIGMFLYFLAIFWRNTKPSHQEIFLVISALILCLIIKRENMVLLSIIPFFVFKLLSQKSHQWFAFVAVALVLYFVGVDPFSTEFIEAEELQTSTFSLSYFYVQLPIYIEAWLNPQLYGISFWCLLISFPLLIYKKAVPSNESIVAFGLLVGYLAIYCLHYRSRYFVLSMELSYFETFRYSNNFYFLIALLVGLNLHNIWGEGFPKPLGAKLVTLFFILFTISCYYTYNFRELFHEEEVRTRIQPILSANLAVKKLHSAESAAILITDIPLVAKMLDEDEFDLLVRNFRYQDKPEQFTHKERIYFLLPEEKANQFLGPKTATNRIELGIETRYVLFQLI